MKNRNSALFTDTNTAKALVEVPDGVTIAFASGPVKNSLTNANWACGGASGGGYGAFEEYSDDGTQSSSVIFSGPGRSKDRFRIG